MKRNWPNAICFCLMLSVIAAVLLIAYLISQMAHGVNVTCAVDNNEIMSMIQKFEKNSSDYIISTECTK